MQTISFGWRHRQPLADLDQIHAILVLNVDQLLAVPNRKGLMRHLFLSYDDFSASAFTIRTMPVSPMLFPIESSRPKIW